jgi:hypothetical protein
MLAVCCAVVGACGGQVSGSPDAGEDGHASSASSSGSASNSGSSSGAVSTSGSGGSGGSGSGGSGSGGPVPLCPPDPPTAGVACASPGQGCAYFVGGQCEGYRCRSSGWLMDPTVTCP